MDYQEKVKSIIYNWVKQEFGEAEAESPRYNIEALAGEISKHAWELYDIKARECAREDVRYVANDILGKDLTDAQLDAITDNYMRSEAYQSIDSDIIRYYIDRELELSESKESKK